MSRKRPAASASLSDWRLGSTGPGCLVHPIFVSQLIYGTAVAGQYELAAGEKGWI